MQIGVVFPQTEIGSDPVAVRDYVQAAEALGYRHLLPYDHVIGANAGSRADWSGAYGHEDMFHEPFVLFGYLAGLTTRIEFVSGIIILPQRQAVLAAKQAAEVDVLTGGRLRLGIGVGWNEVEYQALGEDFHNRGLRSEEQIDVMRQLWTRELVTYSGRWHTITDAGINPLPIQRPIPVWLGGNSEATLRRVGRIGDGWFPLGDPGDETRDQIAVIHAHARQAGRDPASIGIDAQISLSDPDEDVWRRTVESWEALGASHISVNPMGAGLESPNGHIDVIKRFKEALGKP